MVPIRRLLMAGLVLVSTGCLIGCSDNGSNQDSSPQSNSLRLQPITYKSQFTGLHDRASQ